MPKIKVDRIMLMMLNSIPKIPINPKMITQLTSIGRKLIKVSSIRPYENHNAKNIRKEEIYRIR